MTPGDVARLLAHCNLYDNRFGQPSVEVVAAWYKTLNDLDVDDAIEAVARHYSESTERIMPAHIRQGVRAIREERRRNEPAPARALPSRFEDDMGRQVRLKRGVSTIRGVLGPLLEHMAAQRPQLPSAFDELRALTTGPAVIDLDDDQADGSSR